MTKELTPIQLAQDWIDDKPVTGVHKLGQYVYLSCNPDTLHLGHHTHVWAIKNRNVNALIIPDRRTVTPASCMMEIVEQLNRADQQRQELRKVSDAYDWYDVPCKIWKVAPVDQLLPELQHCDLATLAQHSLPVLDRYAEHLIRRYVRIKSDKDVAEVDRDWIRLVCRYSNLGLSSDPDRQIANQKLEDKRLITIAKNRLRQ